MTPLHPPMFRDGGVELPLFHPPVKWRAAIEQMYREACAGPNRITGFTLTPFESKVSGDVAFEVGTSSQTVMPAGAQSAITHMGSYAVIRKRTGADWKIAYLIYNSDQPPAMPPAATR